MIECAFAIPTPSRGRLRIKQLHDRQKTMQQCLAKTMELLSKELINVGGGVYEMGFQAGCATGC